jgi:hypothetical protein
VIAFHICVLLWSPELSAPEAMTTHIALLRRQGKS